jgi:DNA-3-methyladenine glycosylase I
MSEPGGLVTGDDGRRRCAWANSAPEYLAYHDQEWGRPVHGEQALYERFTLEAFQSGLSWLTILRKREGFRRAFDGFDPELVAGYGEAEVARLMADVGIVRNRSKVAATIANAAAVLRLRDAVDGGLDALVWSFAPDPDARTVPQRPGDVPPSTPESAALAKQLRRHGFVFVGPTTAQAAMQACGLVDDHLMGCRARGGRAA